MLPVQAARKHYIINGARCFHQNKRSRGIWETAMGQVKSGNTEQGELSQKQIQRNLSTVGYQVFDEIKKNYS